MCRTRVCSVWADGMRIWPASVQQQTWIMSVPWLVMEVQCWVHTKGSCQSNKPAPELTWFQVEAVGEQTAVSRGAGVLRAETTAEDCEAGEHRSLLRGYSTDWDHWWRHHADNIGFFAIFMLSHCWKVQGENISDDHLMTFSRTEPPTLIMMQFVRALGVAMLSN